MRREWTSVVTGLAMAALCGAAHGQMAVHAVSGKVTSVTASAIDIAVDGNDTREFKLAPDSKVQLEFANDLRADAVGASTFHHVGAFVVVYFYGWGDDETAVAVKELGEGPFAKTAGKLVAVNRHDRTLTLQDDSGKPHTFALGDHLIVDSDHGADDGKKYMPRKGDMVRVTYTGPAEKGTVSFIGYKQ